MGQVWGPWRLTYLGAEQIGAAGPGRRTLAMVDVEDAWLTPPRTSGFDPITAHRLQFGLSRIRMVVED